MDKEQTLYKIDDCLSHLYISANRIKRIGKKSELVYQSQLDGIATEILNSAKRLSDIADNIESEQ